MTSNDLPYVYYFTVSNFLRDVDISVMIKDIAHQEGKPVTLISEYLPSHKELVRSCIKGELNPSDNFAVGVFARALLSLRDLLNENLVKSVVFLGGTPELIERYTKNYSRFDYPSYDEKFKRLEQALGGNHDETFELLFNQNNGGSSFILVTGSGHERIFLNYLNNINSNYKLFTL